MDSAYVIYGDDLYDYVANWHDSVLENYWLNEHGALINFENNVQHAQTRRSLLNAAEYNWMMTSNLDTANDPYDYFISDPAYATLLNIYNEVGVGDTVFVHYPQGIYKYYLHNTDARMY